MEKYFWSTSKKWFNNIWKYSKDCHWSRRLLQTGCLWDDNYFKDYYKLIAIDLGKQKALDADPKPIQKINFTGNLDRGGQTAMFFIIKEAKETILDFSQGTVRVL